MKRTAGTWLLLLTLSGCVSVSPGLDFGTCVGRPNGLAPMSGTNQLNEAVHEPSPAPAGGAAQSPLTADAEGAGSAPRPTVLKPALSVGGAAGSEAEPDDPTAGAGTPVVRLVNSKRILLNYEIKDVGLSGISEVELWFTQDSRNWQKYNGATQGRPPYIVEVSDEGLYGFTLVARSGVGLGRRPPQAGDLPQILVEVDTTKPTVQLVGVKPAVGADGRTLTILWSASDKNLGPQPIALSYAKQARGPWIPLANNVENTGLYHCPMPPSMSNSFFVRVEATDLVGNIGAAQSPHPILVDLSQPKVSILAVESANE